MDNIDDIDYWNIFVVLSIEFGDKFNKIFTQYHIEEGMDMETAIYKCYNELKCK